MKILRLTTWLFIVCVIHFCWAAPDAAGQKNAATSFDAMATPVERIKVADGFKVELLYTVPKESEGSWVNLCVDPKGRFIVSDQFGSLYRVDVPLAGQSGEPHVERIPVNLGHAHGLLWVGDVLYVVVNCKDDTFQNGLYRVRDTNRDDQLDSVELLRALDPGGEHGPHAVLLAPDGKSLRVVCGNLTRPVETVRSRVPRIWDEDRLLPRVYGIGFMRDVRAPGGSIYKVNFDGTEWELIASGFRNTFDAAFNADGELFTYDADMEWDMNTPWYRPTRVCHVVSGAEWGWRNASAKWPPYYPDTLPPVVNIGPGSPTGVTFGYGAKFPAKYRTALYLCDWTFGRLYALHLEPRGATYSGKLEEFVTAAPLPLTDVVVHPKDGALYFLIGGRGVQSGMYRVTYVGSEPVDTPPDKIAATQERTTRLALEELHLGEHAGAVKQAWPYLGHADRFIRFAARTAVEHRPLEEWQQRALEETETQAALTAILALVRKVPREYVPAGTELDTSPPTFPAPENDRSSLQTSVLQALARLDWSQLNEEQSRDLLRVYALVLYRLGPPNEANRQQLIRRLDDIYPTPGREANAMLNELMCYLQAPTAAAKGIALLESAPTQEEQIDMARSLRFLEAGWTPELRRTFFEWFARASTFKGGNHFALFINEMKNDAIQRLPEKDRTVLAQLIETSAGEKAPQISTASRPFVNEWTTAQLRSLLETKLKGRDFAHGRAMFAAANCFACHRFDNEGGAVGPDLTNLAGRFGAFDLLESVIEPNKVISDQYAAVEVVTASGRVVIGRIVNHGNNRLVINTNMLDPNANEEIDRDEIEELNESSVSMMPAGLLNTLHEDEVLDLFAFLLSGGNRNHPMFEP